MGSNIFKTDHRTLQQPETKTPDTNTPDPIKVLVQDYHDLYREALIMVLQKAGLSL
ncbi:hypothetical protein [Paraflavitalea speifideaquila]|uniref:hypothetical protein n=1 Tax=Paraflavitalea speifideaquila TaxID=3076558 RepID=UPI0028EE3A7E|nr:hypothetical protein [Paraflavitalea speifideiaquila]